VAQQIPVPAEVAALKLLDRIDYEDAFTTSVPAKRSPEDWARLALDGAPTALLGAVRCVQQSLGLHLAPTAEDHPLGWTILRSDSGMFVLGADGNAGSARIVCITPADRIVLTTQLRFDPARARLFWVLVAPAHRAVARYLLERAKSRATATTR